MVAELHQANLRRAAIVKIIREAVVHKQTELVKLLKKQGFEATQSSVSRDLRELQVAKAGDRYIVPDSAAARAGDPFAAISGFVTGMSPGKSFGRWPYPGINWSSVGGKQKGKGKYNSKPSPTRRPQNRKWRN